MQQTRTSMLELGSLHDQQFERLQTEKEINPPWCYLSDLGH